ncbi:MAG: energy-coupling factor transporter transmembrane protein EcfT [Acidobacteriota bacterium]|nr:energy-coupling factor transporter transmembrane protein EcfT [Acidobacteriota bacterium]
MKQLQLHPLTWWIWAIGLVTAVIRFDSTIFTLSCVGVVAVVVFAIRDNAPWGKSFSWTIKVAAWILVIRTIIGVLIGVPIPGTTLFRIPVLPLPSWMPGIRIGGAVTSERLTAALTEGLLICAIIVIFGAAASLTSPHKLLRVLPVYVYEFGVAVVIATSVVPQLVTAVARIRQAQRLRGQSLKGFRSWKRVAIPLLEESLARSLDLAASMDSRGYGISKKRSRYRPIKWKLSDLLVIGSALVVVGLS